MDSIRYTTTSRRDEAIFFNNIGHKQYLRVNFDEAVELYTKAIQLDETLGVAYYNRGTVHYRMGCLSEAHINFLKAVELDQANEEFQTALQHCERNLGANFG